MAIIKRIRYSTMEDTFVRIMNLKVRVRRQENPGMPLLLINGMGACLEAWEPLTRRFHGRDIIAVDHPGTGLSSPPNHLLTMSELAAVAAIRTALNYFLGREIAEEKRQIAEDDQEASSEDPTDHRRTGRTV